MRPITIFALFTIALLAACEQRTETRTATDSSGTVQQKTTTMTTTVPEVTVDTAATAEAKRNVQDAGHDVATGARNAAHATGTAIENAGREIQRRTEPAKKKP